MFFCFISPGKPADIHYGTGAISGYFSEDSVTLGDLVVKDQVGAFVFSEPLYLLSS
jgi:phytepsin